MAAFTEAEFDYRRIDVNAIVSSGGIVTVTEDRYDECRDWLRRHGYEITSLDCSTGAAEMIRSFGRLMDWEGQFGYSLDDGAVNLNALRDGFEFAVPEQGGQVLELLRPDAVWQDDPRLLLALLTFAKEHCRFHLAHGRRFFVMLILPQSSPLMGQPLEPEYVPHGLWGRLP